MVKVRSWDPGKSGQRGLQFRKAIYNQHLINRRQTQTHLVVINTSANLRGDFQGGRLDPILIGIARILRRRGCCVQDRSPLSHVDTADLRASRISGKHDATDV